MRSAHGEAQKNSPVARISRAGSWPQAALRLANVLGAAAPARSFLGGSHEPAGQARWERGKVGACSGSGVTFHAFSGERARYLRGAGLSAASALAKRIYPLPGVCVGCVVVLSVRAAWGPVRPAPLLMGAQVTPPPRGGSPLLTAAKFGALSFLITAAKF